MTFKKLGNMIAVWGNVGDTPIVAYGLTLEEANHNLAVSISNFIGGKSK